jgi:hypothetical protein
MEHFGQNASEVEHTRGVLKFMKKIISRPSKAGLFPGLTQSSQVAGFSSDILEQTKHQRSQVAGFSSDILGQTKHQRSQVAGFSSDILEQTKQTLVRGR